MYMTRLLGAVALTAASFGTLGTAQAATVTAGGLSIDGMFAIEPEVPSAVFQGRGSFFLTDAGVSAGARDYSLGYVYRAGSQSDAGSIELGFFELPDVGGLLAFAPEAASFGDVTSDGYEVFYSGLSPLDGDFPVSGQADVGLFVLGGLADVLVDTFGISEPVEGMASLDLTLTYEDDVAAVPLPASLPLLLAGLGGIAVFRRRRSA